MPRLSLNKEELQILLNSIFEEQGQSKILELLKDSPSFVSSSPSLPEFEHLQRKLSYEDYDLTIRHLICEKNTVMDANIQFMRREPKVTFFFNSNRKLMEELVKLIGDRFGEPIKVKYDEYYEGERLVCRQIHYNVPLANRWRSAENSFEEWGSEFCIHDEPYSSGQTNPRVTKIRHDFVVLRFKRRSNADA